VAAGVAAAGTVSICCLPVPVDVLSVLAGQASSTDSDGSRLLWLLAGAAIAAAVVVGGGLIWALASPGRGEARVERPRHRQGLSIVQVPETAPHINGQTPYDALRGVDGVRAVVEQFYRAVLHDPTLAGYFDGVDLPRLKRHQALLISQLLGGPVHYQDLTALQQCHAYLDVSPEAYWRVVGHLMGVLIRVGVPRDVRQWLLNKLHEVEPLIVSEKMVTA
jgi:hemoglobin